jgi:hypothetical protein
VVAKVEDEVLELVLLGAVEDDVVLLGDVDDWLLLELGLVLESVESVVVVLGLVLVLDKVVSVVDTLELGVEVVELGLVTVAP